MTLTSKSFADTFTFSRTGVATVVAASGLITAAASGAPRFDHDPVTLAKIGILLEPARSNLLRNSADLTAIWTLVGSATRTGNVAAAPDGGVSADRVETTNSAAWDGVTQSAATASSTAPSTFSVYLKYVSCQIVRLRLRYSGGTTADYSAYFNIQAGTTAGATAGATQDMVAAGGGWYRCTITAADNGSGNTVTSVSILNHSPAVGDFLAWGAQLEAGFGATSYIPTTSASVARGADTLSIAAPDFSPSWFRQDEGTLLVDYRVSSKPPASDTAAIVCMFSVTGNLVGIRVGDIIGGADLLSFYDSVSQIDTASVPVTNRVMQKAAFAYKTNDSVFVNNGAVVGSDSLCTFPPSTPFQFLLFGLTGFIGHIFSAVYYPKRLSNSELQLLTSA